MFTSRNLREDFRWAFFGLLIAGAFVNVLHLTGSLFMLEVYDRVLPSQSIDSLVALFVLVAALYLFQLGFDILRQRILTGVGASLDSSLSERLFGVQMRAQMQSRISGDVMQPVGDMDQIRSFASGSGIAAFFDFPWLPLYLLACFFLHPLIGYTVIGGAVVLVTLAVMTEWLTGRLSNEASEERGSRNAFAAESLRNSEAILSMGMMNDMRESWRTRHGLYRTTSIRAANVVGALSAMSRSARMMLQSAVMAVGAYLVINDHVSAGTIIASSILSAKALAPVEQAIGHWRGFSAARQSWARLKTFMDAHPEEGQPLPLPRPSQNLTVQSLAGGPPAQERLTLFDVSFSLNAGSALGVIGPSASGKSTFARLLLGLWGRAGGHIRFDGADISQWSREELGNFIGYMPQNTDLMSGTVAENIARFRADATPEAIIDAAILAGAHDFILGLPEGYETKVGSRGEGLSVGQRQRVALARALYGNPFLVVLDEPNSNLDAEGERALSEAIASVRRRGGIAIVIAHRPSALENVDTVMVIAGGHMQQFGTKEEVLSKVLRQNIRTVPQGGAAAEAVADQRWRQQSGASE
ncbi:type I secretion system permease/ATPase [Allorhizobium undicola]|uniref:type I secretion system permease/ATPase n=1 Tax=Allorhizobium undicola TaxID=78527 RepID=UPI000AD2E7D0|nr:type I secretion system permease/ATPase [Allorhizobium undicola]